MSTHAQELEDCFQMTLSQILASDLLDDYDDKQIIEPTLPDYELSDAEILSITYMYEINKQESMIHVYNQKFILSSTHIFHSQKIKLTDEIALQLVNLEKQFLKYGQN